MQTTQPYLERKRREISLLNRCLSAALDLPPPDSPAVAIEQKFHLAAALRAEQSLRSWSVTETARPATQRWRSGAFEFNFSYQRADLAVRGPPIYPCPSRRTTIYTGSGMSAIAALLMGVLRMREPIDVLAARDCYSETRELMQSFGARVRLVAPGRRGSGAGVPHPRILWLDSCVRSGFFTFPDSTLPAFDLIVVDTTCFGQDSGKIQRVMRYALAAGVPVALVRSHAKLDCLGIEYGRLGSIVIATGNDGFPAERTAWAKRLAVHVRDAVRLFGLAPIPVHFAPFAGGPEYRQCNVARISSIIRNTRRLAKVLEARLAHASDITTFQHGLYLTIAPRGDLDIDDVKRAAGALAAELAAQGLCVKHAGSFGFDFVAVEWFSDPLRRRNVIRIAGADLPSELTDRIAEGIAAWWKANRRMPKPTESRRPVASEVAA